MPFHLAELPVVDDGTHETLVAYPASLVQQPAGSNLRCVHSDVPLFGLAGSQREFLQRHADDPRKSIDLIAGADALVIGGYEHDMVLALAGETGGDLGRGGGLTDARSTEKSDDLATSGELDPLARRQ